mgnify:CR=1 FL=1
MKTPKLKYYYFAMNPQEYRDFEQNRTILVMPTTVIDVETGRIFARTQLLLAGSVPDADTAFRTGGDYLGTVYVLRSCSLLFSFDIGVELFCVFDQLGRGHHTAVGLVVRECDLQCDLTFVVLVYFRGCSSFNIVN